MYKYLYCITFFYKYHDPLTCFFREMASSKQDSGPAVENKTIRRGRTICKEVRNAMKIGVKFEVIYYYNAVVFNLFFEFIYRFMYRFIHLIF
jgi:hypothetical protein